MLQERTSGEPMRKKGATMARSQRTWLPLGWTPQDVLARGCRILVEIRRYAVISVQGQKRDPESSAPIKV